MFKGSDFYKNVTFNFSGDNKVCPNDNCKPIFHNELKDDLVVYNLIYNNIGLTGSSSYKITIASVSMVS